MKVKELMELLSARNLTQGADLDQEVSCGYACDLLSWVLAHGKVGMAWMTVQTHLNVVAVAVLMEMACVILVEGVQPEEGSLQKARAEGLAVLSTEKTAYELCGLMAQAGVLPPAE
ncbi:MAG: AraC family transcriptional regulator [Candidatus Limiplasma sp.]|nr:AraC family transcriptional regulator [Candidatus Limiplasma sp.]